LLTFDGGDRSTANGEAAAIFESVDFVSRPERIRNKRRAQLESLMSSRSHHLGSLRSNEMQTALAALLSRRSFDVVQLESSQMGFVLPVPGIPVLVDEHNIEFLLLRRLAGVESSAVRRAFGYLEATKARREELQVWAGCHGVVVTSETDLAVVHSNEPRKPACVVPNGVDIDYFRPAAADPEAATVVFSGAINYRPNTDAVAYFIRDVMPHLKRYNPSARFVVVGQGAPEWLVRMADASVEFTGWVADVRPHLQRAAVVVAPLRAGSGTRLKILEALAMGKPVVTTSIGCEGLSVIDGEHLKVADDPDAFAEVTARLISDRAAAREVGRSGRRLVEREYSWDVIATRMERFHSQLIRKEIRN
jgi:glycosyltransferase involved in cell wall biosynthesis